MGIDFRLLQIHFDANLMTKTHTRIEIKEMKIDYRKMNEQIGVVSVGCVCVLHDAHKEFIGSTCKVLKIAFRSLVVVFLICLFEFLLSIKCLPLRNQRIRKTKQTIKIKIKIMIMIIVLS